MHQGKLLIIGNRFPEPETTAAGNRMMQLIRAFRRGGYTVCFASPSRAGRHAAGPEELEVDLRKIELNNPSFDQWIQQWAPDVVLFDRFMTEEQFGWRVAQCVPQAVRILDTEDLHSLRHAREKKVFEKISAPESLIWRKQQETFRELGAIFRSDLSLIISSFEMDWLGKEAEMTDSILHYLPFMMEAPDLSQSEPWDTRTGFVAIGNGKHGPNTDSFRWLATEIWPLIRNRLPGAKLDVYGAYFPKDILALHNPEAGLFIRGWVQDLKKALGHARVQLAPLRYGAGLKGKLVDSMKYGTPSVTTDIGAEGMRGNLPWNGAIANTPASFSEAAIQLYTGQELWEKAQHQGTVLIDIFFNRCKYEAAFLDRVQQLREQLPVARSENLIGSMLRHHRMASTEYLGKWIAMKKNFLEISSS